MNRRGQGCGLKPGLIKEQRLDLKRYMQSQRKFWTVDKVRNIREQRYAVRYGKRQVQRLLRQMGMYCYKPQPGGLLPMKATKIEVFEFIEIWYNRQRIHASLGYLTPEEYGRKLNQYQNAA